MNRALLVCMLVGCGASRPPILPGAQALVGTWQSPRDDLQLNLDLNADGTFGLAFRTRDGQVGCIRRGTYEREPPGRGSNTVDGIHFDSQYDQTAETLRLVTTETDCENQDREVRYEIHELTASHVKVRLQAADHYPSVLQRTDGPRVGPVARREVSETAASPILVPAPAPPAAPPADPYEEKLQRLGREADEALAREGYRREQTTFNGIQYAKGFFRRRKLQHRMRYAFLIIVPPNVDNPRAVLVFSETDKQPFPLSVTSEAKMLLFKATLNKSQQAPWDIEVDYDSNTHAPTLWIVYEKPE